MWIFIIPLFDNPVELKNWFEKTTAWNFFLFTMFTIKWLLIRITIRKRNKNIATPGTNGLLVRMMR